MKRAWPGRPSGAGLGSSGVGIRSETSGNVGPGGRGSRGLSPGGMGLCGAAGSANSWAGQAYGVGPHAQDWFWVCLAGWRAQILTFHPFPIKPHEFFIGKG